MVSTRSLLERVNSHLEESIGVRPTDSRPQLSPIASVRDIGRRTNRLFGKIDIDRIQPDPQPPRTEFDDETLRQLSDYANKKRHLTLEGGRD